MFKTLWQVDGAVEPLGKFVLVKSAKAEEMTKANRSVRHSVLSFLLC